MSVNKSSINKNEIKMCRLCELKIKKTDKVGLLMGICSPCEDKRVRDSIRSSITTYCYVMNKYYDKKK